MRRLSEAEREILQAMADGHEMVFSQDGDTAWLWPKRPTGFLDYAPIIALRDAGYIARAPFDDEDHIRFGSPDVITHAGRSALAQSEEK